MTAPAINTADLYDDRGEELSSLAVQFQSLGGQSHFSGPVPRLLGDYITNAAHFGMARRAEFFDAAVVARTADARRERGDRNLLGIGVSSYVEITAGGNTSEYAGVQVHDDGTASVLAGTSAHGQGHQTAFAKGIVPGALQVVA